MARRGLPLAVGAVNLERRGAAPKQNMSARAREAPTQVVATENFGGVAQLVRAAES